MAHPNEELLQQGYRDFAAGNVDAVLSIFGDDIVIHISGSHQFSGDYRGHEGALTLFENIAKGSEQTYTQDIHDILANDSHGVVLLRGSGRRSGGQSLDALEVHTWHVAGGKLTEAWTASPDQAAVDAFWG